MFNSNERIIKHKLGLLNLPEAQAATTTIHWRYSDGHYSPIFHDTMGFVKGRK